MDLTPLELLVRAVVSLGTLGGVVALGALGVRKVNRDADACGPIAEMRAVKSQSIGNIAPEYLVRVSGVARPQADVQRTLIGGRPYVAYRLEIFIVGHTLLETTRVQPFYVDDGSGRALVQPPCAVVELTKRAHGDCRGAELPPSVREWLEDATASDEWRTVRHLQWVERWIEPGERVCIVGATTSQVDESGAVSDYRQSAELLTFETADDAPLSVSDDPTLLTS